METVLAAWKKGSLPIPTFCMYFTYCIVPLRMSHTITNACECLFERPLFLHWRTYMYILFMDSQWSLLRTYWIAMSSKWPHRKAKCEPRPLHLQTFCGGSPYQPVNSINNRLFSPFLIIMPTLCVWSPIWEIALNHAIFLFGLPPFLYLYL